MCTYGVPVVQVFTLGIDFEQYMVVTLYVLVLCNYRFKHRHGACGCSSMGQPSEETCSF